LRLRIVVVFLGLASQIKIFVEAPPHSKASLKYTFEMSCAGGGLFFKVYQGFMVKEAAG
jgi:hypothetical protein